MMLSEFTERTGFTPMQEEYEKIEQEYYQFDGDKNAFCKRWLAGGGIQKVYEARAETIRQLRSQMLEIERDSRQTAEHDAKRIAELEARLDKELEWKPCDGGTNNSQQEYSRLENSVGTRVLTDDEAKQLILDEFGFAPDKVKILYDVGTYEANKYHQMRKSATYKRKPLYNATDWNYIRFDCSGWMWEMINGALRQYCC